MSEFNPPKWRWPERGDRLFKPADSPVADVEIHDSAQARQEFMRRGYKVAGDSLIARTTEDPAVKSLLVYPIIYCYRQFIELSLKGQILSYRHLQSTTAPAKIGRTHDLKQLLRIYRRICVNTNPGDSYDMIYFSKLILEFARMDPHSFTFRYATDSKNGDIYPVSTNRIDLTRLKTVMEGIDTFFLHAGNELKFRSSPEF